MSRVNKDQLAEWIDNPVTAALYGLCDQELNNVRDITDIDCLFRGDPQKTQERLIERATKEDEWIVFQYLLKGEWKEYLGDLENYSKLVEEEDEDSDEDNPE
ncbi:hypothetical protein LCGC14_1453610 [marine sediment metagenome]|uniref:Uncharacterized protein n=1 Tax=marine sediment metagenome TaxID=412755 RepID=A0A0F9JH23_9ZZZZ